jgi:serine/threonine-protein kinase
MNSTIEAPAAETDLASWRFLSAALLCLGAALISALLLLQHHGEPMGTSTVQALCGAGQESGCEQVSRSPYAEVAGVPLAALGLFFYLSLALLLLGLLTAPATRRAAGALVLAALILGLGVDVVLLVVQIAALQRYCGLCIATYVLAAGAAFVMLPAFRHLRELAVVARQAEGRLLLAGWLAVCASLAFGVGASDGVLGSRERERNSQILGTSGPAADAEVRRLQEILDNPQKLEKYFADKAAKEYESGQVYSLKLDGVPVKGPEQAPIKVVEYSDFLCPYCRGIAGAFANFLPNSGGRLSVHFKHYPLDKTCNTSLKESVHPGACWLAMGGICAQDQGNFWAYHDKVFSTALNNPQAKDVARLASEAGLDGARLESRLMDKRTVERVKADIAEGKDAGVGGTPTLFINGKRLPRVEYFLQTLEKESSRLGLPPLPPPQPHAAH